MIAELKVRVQLVEEYVALIGALALFPGIIGDSTQAMREVPGVSEVPVINEEEPYAI